jgi:short-subunit dehydrogenase
MLPGKPCRKEMKKSVFHQNVVVITGASMGIGRELAFQLAEQGAWLALAARNIQNLEEVSQQCRQKGGKSICVPTDIASQDQCQNLIESTIVEYGRIDTLINNAGITDHTKFCKLRDFSVFQKVIQVNFWGSLYCTHYALPHLKQSSGRLACISSQLGKFPSSVADGYVVSKHAQVGFYDSLRLELTGSGVSVTMIYPSWVSTGMTSRSLQPDGTPLGKISHHEQGAMPVDVCVRKIIRAIARRKREEMLTLEGKFGLWMRLILPGAVDQVVIKGTE